MKEARLAESVQRALDALGVEDEIVTAGVFSPRGQTGGMFAGGLVGSSLPGGAGDIATAAGTLGGRRAAGALAGLPDRMFVGVSARAVYGFATERDRGRGREATRLLFHVARSRLDVTVRQRVNVRVLELVDPATGTRIELEGSRIALLHARGVIDALRAAGGGAGTDGSP